MRAMQTCISIRVTTHLNSNKKKWGAKHTIYYKKSTEIVYFQVLGILTNNTP
jgi:hypothetical protein